MIKEVYFKKTDKNEYLYRSISIDTEMDQPAKLNIELLKHAEYFNKQLKDKQVNIDKVPQADWVPVSRWTKFICVSKKFKDIFEDKLKGYWHPTNNENYFIFILDNCIKGLNEKTIIVNNKEKPYWYESIEEEVFKEKVNSEYLFTLEVEPTMKLCTQKFEQLYRENNLTGIQFIKDLNFKRSNGMRFDGMRFKKYDDEGNCLE